VRKREDAFVWCYCKLVNVNDCGLVVGEFLNRTFRAHSIITCLLEIGRVFERMNYLVAIDQ
jgi:hypothetical protein